MLTLASPPDWPRWVNRLLARLYLFAVVHRPSYRFLMSPCVPISPLSTSSNTATRLGLSHVQFVSVHADVALQLVPSPSLLPLLCRLPSVASWKVTRSLSNVAQLTFSPVSRPQPVMRRLLPKSPRAHSNQSSTLLTCKLLLPCHCEPANKPSNGCRCQCISTQPSNHLSLGLTHA